MSSAPADRCSDLEGRLQRCTHGGIWHSDHQLAGRQCAWRNLPAASTDEQVQLLCSWQDVQGDPQQLSRVRL